MAYYINKTISASFPDAVAKVKKALQEQGFGVLSEIDIRSKLKEKMNVDFRDYIILGACNPPFAYKALQAEDKIGTMLPCNVIVQGSGPGQVEVAAVDPMASMQAVDNAELAGIAGEVRQKLQNVIGSL
ncbi:MAG: DUF302 domain-containing protein [Desulfosarcinaceae bacterium]